MSFSASCPACCGAIEIHDKAVQSVACPSCLSVLEPANENLRILRKAAARSFVGRRAPGVRAGQAGHPVRPCRCFRPVTVRGSQLSRRARRRAHAGPARRILCVLTMDGLHILAEFHACADDAALCRRVCADAGLAVVAEAIRQFPVAGTSGALVLAESHLAIHPGRS